MNKTPYRDDIAATAVDIDEAVGKALDVMQLTMKKYAERHKLVAWTVNDLHAAECIARLATDLMKHNELWNMGETFERILRSLENIEDTINTLLSDLDEEDDEEDEAKEMEPYDDRD